MRNKILILIILAAVIGGGYEVYFSKRQSKLKKTQSEAIIEKTGDSITHENNGSMEKKDAAMMKDESSMMEEKSSRGEYKDYSPQAVSEAQAASRKVILFFYAPWCPYCRAADEIFRSQQDKIPAGVTVFKTDYDHETDLKQKYGVNYQHTFVQIDSNGGAVTKWVSGDVDLLAKNVK